jgi:hypothetical protein
MQSELHEIMENRLKHDENVTYQLVPGDQGDQHWLVRFLEGPFPETVIQYGAISFNEAAENMMSFNFFIESSPDPDLSIDNVELQEFAGDVLQEIIRRGIEDNSVVMEDK